MALEMNDKSPSGIYAKDAYHRVEDISIKSKEFLFYRVRSYASKDAKTPFNDIEYRALYDIYGDNPIKQAYNHLKKTEKFESALDC